MRVAERGRRALGFSLVTGTHLDMLFVDSEAAGEGAGSALLRRVEAEGARTLEAFRDNHAARAFYERRGWTLRWTTSAISSGGHAPSCSMARILPDTRIRPQTGQARSAFDRGSGSG